MSKKYPDEQVLVISRSLFDDIGSFQGLSAETQRYLPAFLDPENNYFLARDDAEHDPSHKQIIPYAIFHHEGRFLHYVRGGGSGEKRLAAKGSIGIGGHINSEDAEQASLDRDTYSIGVEREIDEELNIEGGHTQSVVALINDDSNEVGAVHLGIVHLFELESDQVTPNEANIAELCFLTADELRQRHDQLETWSQICLDGLEDILAAAKSTT
jgi:predicted NUDIX family phosphoesterase